MPPIEIGVPTTIPIAVQNLQRELSATRTVLDWSLPNPASIDNRELSPEMLAEFGRPRTAARRILARLRDVQADFNVDPLVNVFVNCPYLAPETPYTDIHYGGTFAFFGSRGEHDHQQHEGGREFYIDLTRALDGIDREDVESIGVQFMPIPPAPGVPAEGSFRVGSMDILSI